MKKELELIINMVHTLHLAQFSDCPFELCSSLLKIVLHYTADQHLMTARLSRGLVDFLYKSLSLVGQPAGQSFPCPPPLYIEKIIFPLNFVLFVSLWSLDKGWHCLFLSLFYLSLFNQNQHKSQTRKPIYLKCVWDINDLNDLNEWYINI
jgi:hypothetical protein